MGEGPSKCCGGNDEDAHEHMDPHRKQEIPSSGGFPEEMEPGGFGAGKHAEDQTMKSGRAGAQHAGDGGAASNREYTIQIDRTSGARLGVDVDDLDGASLRIVSVTGGLVEEWNNTYPRNKVVAGDRLIEVNGVRDETQAIVGECKKQLVMKMKLERAE